MEMPEPLPLDALGTSPPIPSDMPEALDSPDEPYQSGGTSWSPYRPDICDLLRSSRQPEIRSIYYGSNACYLVKLLHHQAGESLAIYKPARGEYPLWDFPHGTLHRREVATYEMDSILGWGLVPPTVIGSGRFGIGSVQLFLEESASEAVTMTDLRRLVLLDWVTNNADRKPDHLLSGHGGRLWGIDHGLTFHFQPKLRTVLWYFAGEPLDSEEIKELRRARGLLPSARGSKVRELVAPQEYRALMVRIDNLAAGGVFPNPRYRAVPYQW